MKSLFLEVNKNSSIAWKNVWKIIFHDVIQIDSQYFARISSCNDVFGSASPVAGSALYWLVFLIFEEEDIGRRGDWKGSGRRWSQQEFVSFIFQEKGWMAVQEDSKA